MTKVDNMAPAHRLLVHKYGLNVVQAFIDCGVGSPNRIQHLIETVMDELSATRGSFSSQGRRVYKEGT